jgi:hypothetical protein
MKVIQNLLLIRNLHHLTKRMTLSAMCSSIGKYRTALLIEWLGLVWHVSTGLQLFTLWNIHLVEIIFKGSVLTVQNTPCVFIRKTSRLMLFILRIVRNTNSPLTKMQFLNASTVGTVTRKRHYATKISFAVMTDQLLYWSLVIFSDTVI